MAKARPSRPRPLYAPVSKRPCSRSVSETRSQGQKPAHKDLGRNGQSPAITSKATYAPVSKRPVRALDILSENTDNKKVKM